MLRERLTSPQRLLAEAEAEIKLRSRGVLVGGPGAIDLDSIGGGVRLIPGTAGKYGIEPTGEVWSAYLADRMKPQIDKDGYVRYGLRLPGIGYYPFRAHWLVAITFLGPPPRVGMLVLHRDDNKSNNHYGNLRWGTFSENAVDSFVNGRRPGHRPYAKLDEDKVRAIRSRKAAGGQVKDMAAEYGVSPYTIYSVLHGRNWGSVA